ncbi:hypothetical protein [Rufibacter latericius]|uniref:Outer membrane protein beta-barrel domain-containing protein n=1 Tax=Rufibacter latericius TaxID=2487040 RepID=A0A3M9MZM5_9BACT|nr:hypothetical protein [Rufibacter latericius]RNI30595.1 hypothetical protein EFB08_04925 [Rufibacter latericius]
MKKSLLALCLLLLCYTKGKAQENSGQPVPPSRYLGMVELGYLYQDNKNNAPNTADSSPTLTIFNGYRIHRALSIGATLGLDFYNQVLVTPLALGIRGTLLKTRVSPIYSLDAGYGSTFLSDESNQISNDGGWMINPALGFQVASGNNTAFALSLGYKVQRATTTEPLPWSSSFVTERHSFKRLSAKIGFMF